MNLSVEQENFVKLTIAVLDVIPKHLKDLFKSQWDLKFPKWKDGHNCGQFLFNKIPEGMKKKGSKFTEPMQISVENGITSDQWRSWTRLVSHAMRQNALGSWG